MSRVYGVCQKKLFHCYLKLFTVSGYMGTCIVLSQHIRLSFYKVDGREVFELNIDKHFQSWATGFGLNKEQDLFQTSSGSYLSSNMIGTGDYTIAA